MNPVAALSLACLIMAGLLAVLSVAFLHLRRRHRECRHALRRVAKERDQAVWERHLGTGQDKAHGREPAANRAATAGE